MRFIATRPTYRGVQFVPPDLRRRAATLQQSAQKLVDEASRYGRFSRFRDLETPEHLQPQFEVITTFIHRGFDYVDDIWADEHSEFLYELLQFLGNHKPEWRGLMSESLALQHEVRHFNFDVIVTTTQRKIELVVKTVPVVVTQCIQNFTSEEAFLNDLRIAPLSQVAPLDQSEDWLRRVLAELK